MLEWSLRLTGAAHLLIALAHLWIPHRLHWREDAARLTPVNRAVFHAHTLMIVTALAVAGLASILGAASVHTPSRTGALAVAGASFFWLVRLIAQFTLVSPALWRSTPRRTATHALIAVLCLAFTVTYALAARAMWPTAP